VESEYTRSDGSNPEMLKMVKMWADSLCYEDYLELVWHISNTDEELKNEVEAYIDSAQGIISAKEIMEALALKTKSKRKQLRDIMRGLCEDGTLTYDGKKNGIFRKVNRDTEIIEWQTAEISPINLFLPMGLSDRAVIEKGSVIVIAGVSNAGKSGFLLEATSENVDVLPESYFASEWSPSGLRQRLETFGANMDVWPKVKFIKRTKDFADVIDPNGINIVDFLETHDEFAAVSGKIQEMHDRLKDGVVIVALQKNPGVRFGKGGHGTMEKAQLYLTIDDGIMTVEKLKQPPRGEKNITGLSVNYRYGEGGRLLQDGLWGQLAIQKRNGMPDMRIVRPVGWANKGGGILQAEGGHPVMEEPEQEDLWVK
jgi:hypothetical protein